MLEPDKPDLSGFLEKEKASENKCEARVIKWR